MLSRGRPTIPAPSAMGTPQEPPPFPAHPVQRQGHLWNRCVMPVLQKYSIYTRRAAGEAAPVSQGSVRVSAPPCTAQSRKVPVPAPHLSSSTEAGPAHHSPGECSLQQYLKALFSALLPPIVPPASPKPHSSVPFHLSLVPL